jgi:D-sedoheptulose 7-phosphate isomerase
VYYNLEYLLYIPSGTPANRAGGCFLENHVQSYFEELFDSIRKVSCSDRSGLEMTRGEAYELSLAMAEEAVAQGQKLMFIGNGGSAGIASHMAIDFSKNGKLPAIAFNDGAALTCIANDFGYDQVFAQQIRFHSRAGDVLVAISSSGRSPSILCAVEAAREIGCSVITFSGFDPINPLRSMGDVNFYVARHEYGLVEVAHTALAHAIVDMKTSGKFSSAPKAMVP